MFKRNLTTVEPPYTKGRWYRALIESDGTTAQLTYSDIVGSGYSGNNYIMPDNFVIIDAKYTDYDIEASKSVPMYQAKMTSAGRSYIGGFAPANFTFIEIWVFGYQK